MADIAVSSLIQQIENHIQGNRSVQALAVCTHILYYFPKHLETYSLMAQALALQGNLDGALEVYRRVLSADPENPAAYAGIAHVFDYRHRLEEAVWHMERAFELTPTQPDVRQELLRLYAQFEMEPRVRLKLTRGALARLYVQEGLYDQAIHEFREIGSTSLSRYDVRVALAETLWRAGHTRDAAEVAQSLLDSLPYCLKANLILGTAWHESAIAESQKYLERAVSLDPSNQVALRMLGSRSPLRIASVMVPEYVEGAPPPQAIETKISPPVVTPLTAPIEEDETLSIFDVEESKPTSKTRAEKFETPTETISEPVPEPNAETIGTETEAIIETPQESVSEKSEPTPIPPAIYSAQQVKPSVINADLPPWLVNEDESVTESSDESVAAESVSSGGTPNPEWYAQLRRTFSDQPGEEQGVPAEMIPVPALIESEPVVKPAETVKQEFVQPEPVGEIRTEQIDEDVPDWLGGNAPSIAENKVQEETPAAASPLAGLQVKSSEEAIPVWLKPPADRVVETQEKKVIESTVLVAEAQPNPVEETVPAWLTSKAEEADNEGKASAWVKEPIAPRAEITEIVEPSPVPTQIERAESIQPVRAETPSESTETRVPKWVQVLSQRELEKTTVTDETPARSEPTAPLAQGDGIKNAAARTESVAPAPQIVEPVQPPARSELPPATPSYPKPEPATPIPSPVQASQVAKPEPPIVSKMPSPLAGKAAGQPKPKRQPKYYSRLAEAREHRNSDHIKDALGEYEFVINKAPRLVNEVILDLESLVSTGDAPLDAHRLLGDAYTRAGRLNDALERYRYVKRAAESNQ